MAVAGAPRQNTAHARHTTRRGNGASDANDRGWRHQACRGAVAGACRRTLSDDRRWKSGDVDVNGDSLRAASSRRRHHEPYWLIRAAHPGNAGAPHRSIAAQLVARGVVRTRCAWAPSRLICSTNRGTFGEAASRRIAMRERQISGAKICAWAAVQSLRFALIRTRPGCLRSRLFRTPSVRTV